MAAAIPIVIGAGMSYMAQKDAQDQRESIINRMQRSSQEANARNIALNTDTAQQYDPNSRMTTLNSLAGDKTTMLNQALDQAHSMLPSATESGNVPEAYTTDKAQKATVEKQRELNLTKMLGAIMAPNQLRTNEGYKSADTAGKIGTNASNLKGVLAGDEYDVGKVQADPFLTIGGQAVSGLGTGMASADYQSKLQKMYSGMFKGTGGAPAGGTI